MTNTALEMMLDHTGPVMVMGPQSWVRVSLNRVWMEKKIDKLGQRTLKIAGIAALAAFVMDVYTW